MRIRTQFILSLILFAVVMAAVSTSAVVTNQQVKSALAQENLASEIARGASELSYLANDYVIYREQQQLDRWQARFDSFAAQVSTLRAFSFEQLSLVRNIQSNTLRLQEVFDSVVAAVSGSPPEYITPVLLQVSWSRMSVQSQALVSDASRLSRLMGIQVQRHQQTNNQVVFALVVLFGVYLVFNYWVTQNRLLKSISSLHDGAAIIGRGNLNYRLAEQTNDEIGELASSFNNMTISLKDITASKADLEKEIEVREKTETALRHSEERFRAIAETVPVHISVSRASDGTVLFINRAYSEAYGYSLSELVGKKARDFYVDPADRTALLKILKEKGFVENYEVRIKHANGTPIWVSTSLQPITYAGESALLAASIDITARKHVEANQTLLTDVLRVLNKGGDLRSFVAETLRLIKQSTGFDAVGFRLRRDNDFPYFESNGFTDEFLEKENFLCARGGDGEVLRDASGSISLECTCGLILSGKIPRDMDCFTPGGSFWTNKSTELLALTPETDPRFNPRNRCIHTGFESVGLFPIKSGDVVTGLLQLNARQEGMFTPENVLFFESLASNIGLALQRVTAGDALRDSEERFRVLAETTPVNMLVSRASDGIVLFVNNAYCETFGCRPDDLLGKPIIDLYVDPADRTALLKALDEQGFVQNFETRLKLADGTPLWVSVSVRRINYAGVPAILGASVDITARKQAEAQIAHLASFPELNPNPVIELDIAGNITYANTAARAAFPDLPSLGIRHPFLSDLKELAGTLKSGPKHSIDREIKVGDSWYLQTVAYTPSLNAIRIYGRDITMRKQVEESLRQTTDYLDNLFNYANAPIIVWDPQFRITRFNHAFERLTGLNAQEVIGKELDILFPVDSREDSLQYIRQAGSGQRWETVEIPIQHKDGTVRTVLWNSATLFAPDGSKRPVATIAQGQDITERKLAEEELGKLNEELEERVQQRSAEVLSERQRLYTVLETLPVYVVLLDKDYHVPFANRFFRERFGESRGRCCYEYLFKINQPCDNCESYKVMQTRAPHNWKWSGPDGRDYDIFDYPFTDIDGSFMILEMGIDVTERNKAEAALNELNLSLERRVAERTAELAASNSELEAFAYSVSHDLRAPLRRIEGFSQVILEDYRKKLDEQGKDYLNRIQNATRLMAQLIDDILQLSRVTRTEMHRAEVDLSDIARSISHDLKASHPGRRAEFIIAPGVTARGDASLLRVVLENLLDNAWKFTSKRPVTRIEFGLRRQDGRTVYYVSDNGVGFDMTYIDKIFAPFQRLHSAADYPGTGIGLATVQRVIRRHGGDIWAQSEIDKGTTISFTLGETK